MEHIIGPLPHPLSERQEGVPQQLLRTVDDDLLGVGRDAGHPGRVLVADVLFNEFQHVFQELVHVFCCYHCYVVSGGEGFGY